MNMLMMIKNKCFLYVKPISHVILTGFCVQFTVMLGQNPHFPFAKHVLHFSHVSHVNLRSDKD